MGRGLLVLAILVTGCWRERPSGRASSPPEPLAALVASVGPAPRVAASIAFDEPWVHERVIELAKLPHLLGGRTLAECGVPLDKLAGARLAIGGPLVFALEIDGAIDRARARCILGPTVMQALEGAGFELSDRRGGIHPRWAA